MINRRDFLSYGLKSIVLLGAGNTLQSFASAGFHLPDRRKVKLRFALASDGHYGQAQTTYFQNHKKMVKWLNRDHRSRKLDFSVINGDLFHDDKKFLPEVKETWSRLNMQYYVTHGNHDMVEESVWQQTFGMPWHFAFEKEDVAFLILNTADVNGKYICPDLDWTREQLDIYKSHRHLFVFMHITPVKWTEAGIDCPELVDMFSRQNNLRGIFHGHDHKEDGMKERGGKHYFFDAHIAGNWGTPYIGYRVVEVLENGEILSYQVDPEKKAPVNSHTIEAGKVGDGQ